MTQTVMKCRAFAVASALVAGLLAAPGAAVAAPDAPEGPAAAAAGSPAGPAATAPEPARVKRPNILLINTDDQRSDTLRWMPKTRRWFNAGRQFTRHANAIPSCCPSRAALFSGRYPHNGEIQLQHQARELDRAHTLQAYLKRSGYRTAMAGKFLTSWPLDWAPPHFERYATIKNGYDAYRANENGTIRRYRVTADTPRAYSTLHLADRLRQYLRAFEAADDSRPWFGYFAPQAPHFATKDGLAIPEQKYAKAPVGRCVRPNEADRSDKPAYVRFQKYDRKHYQAICASQARALMSVDDALDDIFRQLQRTGELSNTLVIFTSDNGYLWGEHGRTSKFAPYLPANRVPMLLRWDDRVEPGVDRRLTSHVDLLPTLLQAAGVRLPAGAPQLDGRSLLGDWDRAWQFTEYFADEVNGHVPTWASIANGSWHYIETYGPEGRLTFRELYRLAADPAEDDNLLAGEPSAQDAARARSLARVLAQQRDCAGARCG